MKLLSLCKSSAGERHLLFRMLLIMKLTSVLLLIVALQISAKTFSQRVSIQGKNLSIENIFLRIKKQTGYNFVYDPGLIKNVRPLNLNVKDASLDKVLDECTRDQPFSYEIKYKIIVIKERPIKTNATFALPQQRLTGIIRDENGAPLFGATVMIREIKKGATTNQHGEFVIGSLAPGTYNVVISYIGYQTIETRINIKDNEEATLNLSLRKSVSPLDEIVVVGYGTQKKINLTGSVATVKGAEFENRPAMNAAVGLQGLLPGVEIVSPTGQPGKGSVNIRIRGVNTLKSDNGPLVLIDGVEGDLTMINPDDIESVTVLKDAASSAIYGARAATGVLLVTTKTGKLNGKTTINYSGYAGFQTPTALPELVDGRQYMELYNEALSNAGLAKLFLDSAFIKYDQKLDPNNYSNTDWINEVYKESALQQSHNLNVDGGSANTGYHLSYGLLDQDGLVVANPYSYRRQNFRMRVNTQLFNRLKVDGIISYSNYYRHDAAAGGTAGVFRLSQRISPLLPLKWSNQNPDRSWTPTDYYSYGSVNNPVDVANNSGYYTYRSNIPTANISASLNIVKGLDFSAQYAFRETFGEAKTFSKPIYKYNPDGSGIAENSTYKNSISLSRTTEVYQNYSNTLTYENTFGKHAFKLMGGYSEEWVNSTSLGGSRTKILDDTEVLDNGTEEIANSGTESHWALRSWFGRFNYNFNEKYLLEANVRRDGSSRFAKDHRWGTFPSFSAGWNINKEPFMQFINPIVQLLKLRGSFGRLGNQNVGDLYPYLTPITSAPLAYPIGLTNNIGYTQSSIGNSSIHWETVEVTNLGLDAQILRSRLSLTAEWFVKNNKDALLKPVYPSIIGTTSSAALPYANVGKVQSKGWEFTAGWNDQVGQVRYGVDFIFSDVKNIVKSLGNTKPSLGNNIFRVGDPLNAFYGYRTDGLAQISDFDSYNETTGKYTGPKFATINSYTAITQPGDIKYRDISGPEGVPDGIIDDNDKVVIGDSYPRYSYSFRGNLNWKNIDFSFFLQGVQKVNGYISDEAIHAFINDYSVPQKIHLDRWTPTNTGAKYPRLYYAESHNREFSDYWLQNGSYLRVKNIQLGYTFNKKSLAKANIDKLRIYVSAQNPFTVTDYFYAYDPEVRSTAGDSYPQVKTLAFGLNATLK